MYPLMSRMMLVSLLGLVACDTGRIEANEPLTGTPISDLDGSDRDGADREAEESDDGAEADTEESSDSRDEIGDEGEAPEGLNECVLDCNLDGYYAYNDCVADGVEEEVCSESLLETVTECVADCRDLYGDESEDDESEDDETEEDEGGGDGGRGEAGDSSSEGALDRDGCVVECNLAARYSYDDCIFEGGDADDCATEATVVVTSCLDECPAE